MSGNDMNAMKDMNVQENDETGITTRNADLTECEKSRNSGNAPDETKCAGNINAKLENAGNGTAANMNAENTINKDAVKSAAKNDMTEKPKL